MIPIEHMGAATMPKKSLTTHHTLKLVAIALMTADHIGTFLYPDALWLRVVGRFSFPLFLFLVGHAPAHSPQRELLLWGLVLAASAPFLGVAFFPLNILVTIYLCQWLLVKIEQHDWLMRYPLTLLVGSVLFSFPLYLFLEYSSVALLLVLMGYAVRRRMIYTWRGYAIIGLILLTYVPLTFIAFDFSLSQQCCVALGTVCMLAYLSRFTYRLVKLPQVWSTRAMLFLARHSMEYYVLHRLALQALGVLLGVLTVKLRWL